MGLVLAQSVSLGSFWVWILVLLGVVLVGAVTLFALRRRLLGSDASGLDPSAGLFEQLDQMRRSGQISEEEYAQTRKAMIERHSGTTRDT